MPGIAIFSFGNCIVIEDKFSILKCDADNGEIIDDEFCFSYAGKQFDVVQNHTVMASDVREVLLGAKDAADCFANINDVDQIAAGINVRPHLWVPTT